MCIRANLWFSFNRDPRLPDGVKGLDIGPGTAAKFSDVILDARMVFWNGPMGMFEDPRFAAGTRSVASAMAATLWARRAGPRV